MTVMTPDRTSRREDLLSMLFGLWTLVGLLVDAYYHVTDPGLESFWTPWHALFYSGFTATAAWLGWLTLKRVPRGAESSGTSLATGFALIRYAPIGYRLALIGVVVFAVGGIGDAIWHTIFGIEVGLDALLSPTHLLLFVGLLLIVTAPLRAAWTDNVTRPGFVDFSPALLSLTIGTTITAFFLQYAWAVTEVWMMQVQFQPDDGYSSLVAGSAVLSIIVTTAVMFTPLLVAARRWHLPFGTAVITFTVVNIFVIAGFDEPTTGLPAVIVGGLLFDVIGQSKLDRRWLVFLPPVGLWLVYFWLVSRTNDGLGLVPEIWAGAVVFAALVMLAVDLLLRIGGNVSPVGLNSTKASVPAER